MPIDYGKQRRAGHVFNCRIRQSNKAVRKDEAQYRLDVMDALADKYNISISENKHKGTLREKVSLKA